MNQQLPNFASSIVDALGRAALPSASEPEDVASKAGLMFVVLKSKGSDDAGDAAPCADCICSSPESLTQTEAQAPQPPEPNSTIFVYDHFLPAPLRSEPAEGDPIFYVSTWKEDGVGMRVWKGSAQQRRALERGTLYGRYLDARTAFVISQQAIDPH